MTSSHTTVGYSEIHPLFARGTGVQFFPDCFGVTNDFHRHGPLTQTIIEGIRAMYRQAAD